MKQYLFKNNKLILTVKKSPFFIRLMMFLFSFLFFLLPLGGMISSLIVGDGFHIGFMVGFIFFGLLGFYLLRIALWNTYGKEKIIFIGNQITYSVNYGWFKDSLKTKELNPISYFIKKVGYEEEKKGVLVIGTNENKIETVTKISINEIEELIDKLKKENYGF